MMSSQIFMKVKRSTLVGMAASCVFVKWNSEFERDISAAKWKWVRHANGLRLKVVLTLAALLLVDLAGVAQIVKSENVLHLRLSVDNGAGALLDASLNLLAEEALQVVGLLVGDQRGQVLEQFHDFVFSQVRVRVGQYLVVLIDLKCVHFF